MGFNVTVKTAIASLVLGTVATIGGVAQAVPTYCSAGPHAEGLAVSDVTYSQTGVAPFTNATDCYGVVDGNINPTNNAEDGIFGATAFQHADSSNEPSGTATLFGGAFTFTLSGPASDQLGGLYTLSATDNNGGVTVPNFPFFLDFVVAVKASDRFALYYFNDAAFDGSGGGTWSITYENNGGQIPGLSHLAVFVREGAAGTPTQQGVLPEPASLALLGLGLAGLAFSRRKQ